MKAVVLVTGATGFVGCELVRQLLARGTATHAFARPSSERGPLAGLPVAWHAGDLCDAASVEAAVRAAGAAARASGCALQVVHSGALISYATRDRAAQQAVNVEGTRNVLGACERHAVARLCFVSSVVAVGPSPDGRPLDERSAFHGAGVAVDYMRTKRAAEELVLQASGRLDVVVANPGAVFGPAQRSSNTVRFLRQVAAGRRPPCAPPGSIAVVGLEDTARGILLVLEHGRRGERYLLVERCFSARELFGVLCRALGQRDLRWTVPHGAWPLLVAGVRLLDRVRPLELTSPQALAMLGQRLVFDAGKARRELGWQPRPFDLVLDETIRVLRERGELPPAE